MTMSYHPLAHHTTNGGMDKRHRHFKETPHLENAKSTSTAKCDQPPNSRLFILCGRDLDEEDFKTAFNNYGTIEEVWVRKDKVTGEPKGVTYIKFSKTSEAALAMEEMNGRIIGNSPRPLKVLIAHSKDQGSRRDINEDDRLVRLFVVVNKTMTENELKEHFGKFGDIDYVSIVKDRTTKQSKGFAYVKYHRMYHAAKAYEECDRNFKPVFADPKPQKNSFHDGNGHGGPGSTASGSTSISFGASYDSPGFIEPHDNGGVCRLTVSTSAIVNQDQIWRLFDLIPGLDYCEKPRDNRRMTNKSKGGFFRVVYNNAHAAMYAKEKLHGFEYPPGHRLVVKLEFPYESNYNRGLPPPPPPHPLNGLGTIRNQVPIRTGAQPAMGSPSTNPPVHQPSVQNDLVSLNETIANATALLQAAGYGGGGTSSSTSSSGPSKASNHVSTAGQNGETYDPSYCTVKLPPPQPLVAIDSVVEERLFIVCTPAPPQLYTLKDVFGRFGSLIDIYLLNGKSCGYAKYASKQSADQAVATLHGQEICGSRLKVMPADPQDKPDSARKRPKTETN